MVSCNESQFRARVCFDGAVVLCRRALSTADTGRRIDLESRAFKELRAKGFVFVDKTGPIADLLSDTRVDEVKNAFFVRPASSRRR